MSKRIYVVHHSHSDKTKLVRASNVSQAIRHVSLEHYTAHVASQDDLIALLGSGVEIEETGREK